MPADPTHIARQLAAAFTAGPADAQSTLRSLYADQVELRHIPALPSDGLVDGSRLREAQDREAAAIGRVIPEYSYDDVKVEVDGDRVHVTAWIHGAMTTGISVRLLSDMYCTVRDGSRRGVGTRDGRRDDGGMDGRGQGRWAGRTRVSQDGWGCGRDFFGAACAIAKRHRVVRCD